MTTPSAAGPTGLSRARDVVTVVLVAAFAYAGTRYGAGFTPRGAAVFAAGCALVPYGLERLGAAQTRETGVLASLAGTVLIVFAILAERTGVIPEALGGVPEPTVVITPGYEPPGEALPGSPPTAAASDGTVPLGSPDGTAAPSARPGTEWAKTDTARPSSSTRTGPATTSPTTTARAGSEPGVPSVEQQDLPPVTSPQTAETEAVAAPQRMRAYDNYGPAIQPGQAMCSGNPARPESMPGGTLTQTFVVPNGVSALDAATIQIDPNPAVTAQVSLAVSGGRQVSAIVAASGDTTFAFPRLAVTPGQTVTLSLSFSATQGKLITVYVAGAPGGQFRAQNTCSDGAPSTTRSPEGLRAVISGWS